MTHEELKARALANPEVKGAYDALAPEFELLQRVTEPAASAFEVGVFSFAGRTLRGADFVGSPDEIIEKILFQHEIFNHRRVLLQLGLGGIPHAKMMRAIELLGTQVAPVVREEIGRRMAQTQ
jgi:hypothetical protein